MSRRPLRIAQIAPVGTPVRRDVGESVEQLIALTCDELVARGHHVTLFATGDSETTAELRYCYERGYDNDPDLWDWQFAEYRHVGHAYAQADDFDVIHCHSHHFGLPFAPFVRIPNVHTHHVEMEPGVVAAYRTAPQVHLVAISDFQARTYAEHGNVEPIPHGIATAEFPFGDGRGGYLLFLGRMIEDKGPSEAIEIARAAGIDLVLAGPVQDPEDLDESDFDVYSDPRVDGRRVFYMGRVEAAERNRWLAGAGALLYPLRHPEPFGLVMAEAMACGTPVVGVGVGAVPEIVEPGLTGYMADSWEGLTELVPRALELDRHVIRARAVERFDHRRMIDGHEALYRRLVEEAHAADGLAEVA